MILRKKGIDIIYIRLFTYVIGLLIFSYGIATAINVQHLGIHPWDVLSVGLYERFGLTIGSWNIIIGFLLIGVALILDRTYVKAGTFFNAVIVGVFVDIYLKLGLLLPATHTWTDILVMIVGIIIMGFGGGVYNAPKIGSGPRDGFMLSISDKVGWPIGRVRIVTETTVLLIGLLIGGPVFVFTFIFTFVQSPIFQFTYLRFVKLLEQIEQRKTDKRVHKSL